MQDLLKVLSKDLMYNQNNFFFRLNMILFSDFCKFYCVLTLPTFNHIPTSSNYIILSLVVPS